MIKIPQKHRNFALIFTRSLLLWCVLFLISNCSTATVVVVETPPSTGVRIVTPCPVNITKVAALEETSATVTWDEPTATDSNGDEVIPFVLRSGLKVGSDGSTFALGETKVSYSFTDAVGHKKACSFKVRVSQPASTGVRIVTPCPANITKVTVVGEPTVAVTWTPPTATDSNGDDVIPVVVRSGQGVVSDGSTFGLGEAKVSYSFTDAAGHRNACSFTVRVSQPISTDVRIVAQCPADIEEVTAVAERTVAVTWTPPTAKDGNSNPIEAVVTYSREGMYSPGAHFPLGTTSVTYTFTDAAGHKKACSFKVRVSQPASTGVTIVTPCPADRVQVTPGVSPTAVVTWTEPTAKDSNNNDVMAVVTYSPRGNYMPGAAFYNGMTSVTYTFRDAVGNTATCSFKVRVYYLELADDAADPSPTNPFLIQTGSDLVTLATLIDAGATYTLSGTDALYAAAAYRLENSLDLDPTLGYTHTPIGSTGLPFIGTFDGNDQTLTNLSYSDSHRALGLFSGISNATISDLTLSNPAMTNTTTNDAYSTGALVGTSAGSSVISNVSVIEGSIEGNRSVGGLVGRQDAGRIMGSSATGDVTGDRYVGGLVGRQEEGTITASYATGAVSGGSSSYYTGGLVGFSKSTITASYARGAVSGNNDVGGLVGRQYEGTITASTITASYATGDVSGSSRVGGLVGSRYAGTITDSTATGAVSGTSYVGGLVGSQDEGTITASTASGAVSGTGRLSAYVGGLVGSQDEGTITASYATGDVSGSSNYVGGLVGYQTNGTITASYATGAVSGTSRVGGLVGQQDEGTITNSYATGDVSGSGYSVGGLVGFQYGSMIEASYWDTETTGQTTSAGGLGYPTVNLQIMKNSENGYSSWESPPWVFETGKYPSFSY